MKVSVIASTKENYVAPREEFDRISGHSGGVCYMTADVDTLLNEPESKTINRVTDNKHRQHHSVCGHPQVTLALENIPKGLAMVLNNEGIYNASEKSARYTKMVLTPEEQALYDKWLDIYKNLIREEVTVKKYPEMFTEKKIGKLAQEKARYLISVFTPTSMIYTVSYQQLNYLYQMIKNEIASENSNAFMKHLKPAMSDFIKALEGTPYIDEEIAQGVNNKNRKLSLFGDPEKPEEYFGDVYSTSYLGTFAQFAQTHRHRTIDYNITLLDEPKFFIPPIIAKSDDLLREWVSDCRKQAPIFPQGMLVNINEFGTMDWFIQKMKERKCGAAQLEINLQTDATLNKYVEALRAKKHRRAEELAKYTKGSRCTFPDYKCPDPCGWKDGIDGSRII